MIRVKKVETDKELKQTFKIREAVFVGEMKISPDEFSDDFDNQSVHFIAYVSGKPVGASRYRVTEDGIKLDRFAVLKEYRGKGVGKRLIQTALGQIEASFASGTLLYLHAQLNVLPLYARYGFEPSGEKFMEAGKEHYQMRKNLG